MGCKIKPIKLGYDLDFKINPINIVKDHEPSRHAFEVIERYVIGEGTEEEVDAAIKIWVEE